MEGNKKKVRETDQDSSANNSSEQFDDLDIVVKEIDKVLHSDDEELKIKEISPMKEFLENMVLNGDDKG
ncbi:hypothetical protein [Butyrivibrio sp. AC2005]|uniref:hypothetical protein n=1 Tax=Butyrivibrio sp. AC2005 TaxID=1280672 RepID=UPI0003FE9D7F|nr:hypothetical protein [Butyrivibrio sp. AC2005]